jgi:hypothetical protein
MCYSIEYLIIYFSKCLAVFATHILGHTSHINLHHGLLLVFLLVTPHYTKWYKCLNLQTNKTFISRKVNFDESSFQFKNFAISLTLPSSLPISTSPLVVLQPPSSTLFIPIPHLSYTLPILSTPSHTSCRVYERRKSILSTPSAPFDVLVPTHSM